MTSDDKKISSLYQQGKDKNSPAHLDEIILQAAHAAVSSSTKKTSAKTKSPFSGGWPAMASIAALLLITVILVPVLEQETPPTTADSSAGEILGENKLAEQELRRLPQLEQSSSLKTQSSYKQSHKQASVTYKDTIKKSRSGRGSAPILEPMTMSASPSVHPHKKIIGQQDAVEVVDNTESPGFDVIAKKWLLKIRLLIERNKLVEAREELVKFKEKYPDEKIDPAILDKLYLK